jgi:hypothetical protein
MKKINKNTNNERIQAKRNQEIQRMSRPLGKMDKCLLGASQWAKQRWKHPECIVIVLLVPILCACTLC